MTTQVTELPAPPPPRLAKELIANTAFLLARVGYGFKAKAIAEVEQAGFSLYDYSVLALLGEQARETQATIADALVVLSSAPKGPPVPMEMAALSGLRNVMRGGIRLWLTRTCSIASGMPCPAMARDP